MTPSHPPRNRRRLGRGCFPRTDSRLDLGGFLFVRGGNTKSAGSQDLFLDLGGDLGILEQESPCLFLALSQIGFAVFEPGPAAGDDLVGHTQV